MEAAFIPSCVYSKFSWNPFQVEVFTFPSELYFVDVFKVLTIAYIDSTKVSSLNKFVSYSCKYFSKFLILSLYLKFAAEITSDKFKSLKYENNRITKRAIIKALLHITICLLDLVFDKISMSYGMLRFNLSIPQMHRIPRIYC